MGIFDLHALEWTPPAILLTIQTFLMFLTGVQVFLGQTDTLYKYEPHTKEISSRGYEVGLGGGLVGWGCGVLGAVIAGGAHFMCILQLIPMLFVTHYHYVGKGNSSMLVNTVFMVALAYLGFVPLPKVDVESIEWTPAAILMTAYGTLCALAALAMLAGKTEQIYEAEPHTKAVMSRQGERQQGSCLLGFALGVFGAVIAGGAQDMCILYVIGVFGATYFHYTYGGPKKALVNVAFMAPALYLGFVR